MAIHIDIYAHLRRQEIIREGEKLKRDVERLEKDINTRWEKGAEGRSQKIIKLNDAVSASFDRAVNHADRFTAARKRQAAATAALTELEKVVVKTEKEAEEHAKNVAAAEREQAAALREVHAAAQALAKTTNDYTRSIKDAGDENEAFSKNLRQVTMLVNRNKKAFDDNHRAVLQQRGELLSLSRNNRVLVESNKAIVKSLDAVAKARQKTDKERKKYIKLTKEEGVAFKVLSAQADKVHAAYAKESELVVQTTEALGGLVKQRKLSQVVADANRDSMHRQARAAFAARRAIEGLREQNTKLIGSNKAATRAFDNVRTATDKARREHQKFTRMVNAGASQDSLREQAEKVNDAYINQGRAVREATDSLTDLASARDRADIVVRGNADRLNYLSSQAVATSKSIRQLRDENQKLYDRSGVVSRAFLAVSDATDKAQRAHQEYNRMTSNGATQEQLRKQLDAVTDAYTRQERAAHNATSTLAAVQRQEEDRRKRGHHTGGVLGRMLTDLPFVPGGRAGVAIGGTVMMVAAQAAEAVVTASQALALLPAMGAAGAAGIATLTIGLQGFGDALKNMDDPKKFAEALATMSPAAQQAALEIQWLAKGPLKELKTALQENLFSGVAEQLHKMTGALLPQMNRLTSGIAKSANAAFMNFTDALQTPEALSMISITVGNIVNAFRSLEPAIEPFTNAMLTITKVGSSFLPGIGDDIARLAEEFSNFIQKAAADGSLQTFFERGIVAAKLLGSAILDLGTWIYETFGNKTPEEFKNTLDAVVGMIKTVIEALVGMGNALNTILEVVRPIAEAVGGWENLFLVAGSAIVAWKARGVLKVIGDLAAGLMDALAAMKGIQGWAPKVSAALAAIQVPAWIAPLATLAGLLNLGGSAPHLPQSEDLSVAERQARIDAGRAWEQAGPNRQGGATNNPWVRGETDVIPPEFRPYYRAPVPGMPRSTLDAIHGTDGGLDALGNPLFPDYHPFDVPGVPGDELSDKEIRDAIWASMDPNAFMPDLSGIPSPTGIPPGPTPLQWGNGGDPYEKPGYGYYERDIEQIQSEYADLQDSARALRDARMDAEIAQQDGISSQRDIFEAKEEAAKKEQAFNESVLKYHDALRGKWTKADEANKNAFEELNAGLDADLGLSRGLAGLADNIVRFVGKIASAPLLGAMNSMIGGKDVSETGSGLLGMLAENMLPDRPTFYGPGYGNPNPAAGPDYYSLPPGTLSGIPTPGRGGAQDWSAFDAALFSRVPSGAYGQDPGRNLLDGLSDCSSSVSDLVNILDRAPEKTGGNMTTMNAMDWLSQRGFVPGVGGPGDFRVGWDAGHMQATLPGGSHWNWGNDTDAANRGYAPGSGGAGIFSQQMYRPGNTFPFPSFDEGGQVGGASPGGGSFNPNVRIDTSRAGTGNRPWYERWSDTWKRGMRALGQWPNGGPSLLSPDELRRMKDMGAFGNPEIHSVSPDQPPIQGWPWGLRDAPPGGAVPIIAHTGEHVLTARDVAAMGGQRAVYDFRRALHYDLGGIPGLPPRTPGPSDIELPKPDPNISLTPEQLTDPGLTPAAVPSGVAPAAGGQNLTPPAQSPQLLPGGQLAPAGVPTEGSHIGAQVEPYQGYGSGLTVGGGIVDALTGAAGGAGGMAIDAMAPGAGAVSAAAIQIGIQEIQRAIEFAGQAAGIGVQGLMETFMPAGGSALAQENWLMRFAGGIAGAAPALPNMAGGALAQALGLGKGANLPGVGAATPEQIAAQSMDPNRMLHTGVGPPPGPTTTNGIGHVENLIMTSTEDRLGQDIARYQPTPGAR